MLKVRSSRRVAGLKPSDYDHEISLFDRDADRDANPDANHPPRSVTSQTALRRESTASQLPSINEGETAGPSNDHRDITSSNALDQDGDDGGGKARAGSDDEGDLRHRTSRRRRQQPECDIQERPVEELRNDLASSHSQPRPSIEVQAPSPEATCSPPPPAAPKPAEEKRETVIDVLYENERGGFLCGTALFSGKALGGLDPSPWTNIYHKTSPTTIHTATVPDPSWEWIWPDWRVNCQEGMDDHGWDYSFAFSGKFSWHGPRWWNSFVRRRAWIRRRARKRPDDPSVQPNMLNADYFTVCSASDRSRRSPNSLASSRVPSKNSMTQASTTGPDQDLADIDDIETLMQILRLARIDREKREAVQNYLEHGADLAALQNEMHEIMAIFIFQASRRQLLSHLMQKHDETVQQLKDSDTPELQERKMALDAAVKHADEEVRRLAYWSDVKQMADSGESRGAVDGDQGWHDAWQGLDNSGPSEPNRGKLPGP